MKRIDPLRDGSREAIPLGYPDGGARAFASMPSVPRLSLRLEFGKQRGLESVVEHVLCPFDETVASMREGRVPMPFDLVTLVDHTDAVHGIPTGPVRAAFRAAAAEGAGGERYAVLRALLLRVHVAQTQAAAFDRTPGGLSAAWRFRLFADAHLPLSDYMVRYAAYRDAELATEGRCRDHLWKSAVGRFGPRDADADGVPAYCGDLPDITHCIASGNFWYDVRPTTPTMASAIVHIFGAKTQGHRCQLRNFASILHDYFSEYPPMVDLVRRCVEVSLFGNYPHARYRPPYAVRMRIYRDMRSPAFTDRRFFLWVMENRMLVFFVLKELFVYAVSLQPALDVLLDDPPGRWEETKRAVAEAMDSVRSNLANNERDPWDVEETLKMVHRTRILPSNIKLKKGSFVDILCGEMDRYHDAHVVDRFSVRAQRSEDEIGDAALVAAIDRVAARFGNRSDNRVETRWLKCFGASEAGYEALRDLYFAYETDGVPDNGIPKRIDGIYRASARDFHLIRVYFSRVRDVRKLREHRLSLDCAERQVAALRAKHFVMPWEALDPDADLFYFCRACKKWASPVVDAQLEASWKDMYAIGRGKGVLYDRDEDELYCGNKANAVSVRKARAVESGGGGGARRSPSAPAAAAPTTAAAAARRRQSDARNAKALRSHNEQGLCRDRVLDRVHMIGRVKVLGRSMWALCTVCATITAYDASKIGPNGFTCGVHGSGTGSPPPKPVPGCPRDDRLARMRAVCDAVVPSDARARCYHCGARPPAPGADVDAPRKKKEKKTTQAPAPTPAQRQWQQQNRAHVPIRISDQADEDGIEDGIHRVRTVMLCAEEYDHVRHLFREEPIVTRARLLSELSYRFLKPRDRWNIMHVLARFPC